MKKLSTLKTLIFFIGIFWFSGSFAQTWTIYDGAISLLNSANSTGAAWSEGDKVGTYTTSTINTDAANNSSLAMVADVTNRSSYKSPSLTDATYLPVSGTLLFRAKSNITSTLATDFGFMLEFYSVGLVGASNRFEIRLLGDGTIKLSNAAVSTYSYTGLNLNEYHTYRITVEIGNLYKVYLDENPTPLCSGVSSLTTSTNKILFRTGCYQTSGTYSFKGELDWMAWDATAAYAPGTTLPTGVTVDQFVTGANKLISSKLNLFPNPVAETVLINDAAGINKYEIIGSNGSIMTKGTNQNSQLSVNVINLKSGIYFIKLYSGTQSEQIKFIKE